MIMIGQFPAYPTIGSLHQLQMLDLKNLVEDLAARSCCHWSHPSKHHPSLLRWCHGFPLAGEDFRNTKHSRDGILPSSLQYTTSDSGVPTSKNSQLGSVCFLNRPDTGNSPPDQGLISKRSPQCRVLPQTDSQQPKVDSIHHTAQTVSDRRDYPSS